MTIRKRQITPLVLYLLACLLSAATAGRVAAAEAGFGFEALKRRLVRDGFDAGAVGRLYARPEVVFEADGVALFFVHRESKLNYDQFSEPESLAQARAYLQRHQGMLSAAEAAHGVDRHVITAILLVESRLGRYVGKRSALSILSTMAALEDPAVRGAFWKYMTKKRRISRKRFEQKADRKSRWAYNELKALLIYAAREGLDAAGIRGSYAGAVGLPQFMPSNILRYGTDGDNDGRIDLESHADAAASIAAYLKGHGWRPGIGRQRAQKVIYSYNHSTYYVRAVIKIANLLRDG